MVEEISEINKTVHEALDLLHKGASRNCLFEKGCAGSVVNAHAVSQAILDTIQEGGHLKGPQVKYIQDEKGRSCPHVEFNSVGITQASIGTFACQTHEVAFERIDTIPMDFEDPGILDLLLYRAVLREIWLLSKSENLTDWVDQRAPYIQKPPIHPDTRLESLQYFRECIRPQLKANDPIKNKSRVQHMVRCVKSDSPILATSSASGGSMLVRDPNTGEVLPAMAVRTGMGMEPYTCWGLTIIPQNKEHMVLISWLEGSAAELYFEHLRTAQGKELEAAVSVDLLLFSENWFLSPKVWAAYGAKKQEAIITAFTNFPEMLSGQYSWLDKNEGTPWYEYLKIPNRHQLNLFRYDQSK